MSPIASTPAAFRELVFPDRGAGGSNRQDGYCTVLPIYRAVWSVAGTDPLDTPFLEGPGEVIYTTEFGGYRVSDQPDLDLTDVWLVLTKKGQPAAAVPLAGAATPDLSRFTVAGGDCSADVCELVR